MRRVAVAEGHGRQTGRVTAVLGPTNTGKTHLAVERMLGHASGVIGLPLRLLAREIYDRVVAERGAGVVALVTGEEKIVPPNPVYFVCTVESMPVERRFEFLAVDEIQLCADAERGHVFTDRLLHARGDAETMFLGADTIRRLLTRLVPEAEVITRPRFSTLSYAGPKKLSRLPRRSAVVAFSANDVYAVAELMRRQRGGAAVVMGALSPRTRNAQVAMYQAGEVDFLVATDAIGMGLNMDIDHVAFAQLGKFDGTLRRRLTPAEVGQIAGRAGRHMNDGSFGTSAEVGDMEPELVEPVEGHRFDPLKQIHWRNSDLVFNDARALARSLETAPPEDFLIRPREAIDAQSLRALIADPEVADLANGQAAVRLLWQVCQIPDFRKTMQDQHVGLLGQVFRALAGPDQALATDWVARQVDPLDRTEGDIDTLASRIAHVRTWTYISHRPDWLADPLHWQERARAIEDRLSDALHERLTQRFVDRGSAALMSRLKDRAQLTASVDGAGEVAVEGHYVGRLQGLRFAADDEAAEGRQASAAINRVLGGAVVERGRRLAQAPDDAFAFDAEGGIHWDGGKVAYLAPGDDVLRPRVKLMANDHLHGANAEQVRARLAAWTERQVDKLLAPLKRLAKVPFTGAGRGIAFQLVEGLGVLNRRQVADQVGQLDPKDFGRFKYNGVQLGRDTIFLPALLKPEPTALRCLLWTVREQIDPMPEPPRAGRVSFTLSDGAAPDFLRVAGYRTFGGLAIRIDMVERVAEAAHRALAKGPVTDAAAFMSLLGCGRDDLALVMTGLGYRAIEPAEEGGEARFLPQEPRRRPAGAKAKGQTRAQGKAQGKTQGKTKSKKAQTEAQSKAEAKAKARREAEAARLADSPFAVLRQFGGGS